jgi:hypothetical protein
MVPGAVTDEVTKVDPVPSELPPTEDEYQLSVPEHPEAPNVTGPVPQRSPGIATGGVFGLTITSTDEGKPGQPLTVTMTVYVPAIARVAFGMVTLELVVVTV